MTIKVDFIGLGAGKSGSTWLHDNLAQHPEICDRNLKELNYFSGLYDRHPISWYESQFAACPEGLKKGEFSVTYLPNPDAAHRIHRHYPDARLLAILRNPVNRTFSNYLHSIRKGDISPKVSFATFIEDEKHLAPSRYAKHIERFYRLFPADQFLILITEEFLQNPLAGYRSVFEHLGLSDTDFVPPGYDQPRNKARSYRFLWLENLLVRTYRTLSIHGYTRVVKRIIDSRVGELLRRINRDKAALPKIDEDSRRALEDYFAPHNEQLAELLNRDRPIWPGEVHGG